MTYQARLYDSVTPASVQGDVEWYRKLAVDSGGPVLDLAPEQVGSPCPS